jgi:hypothetical protein
MMDLGSFLFGFWMGCCVIILIWAFYVAGKESAKKEAQP